MTTVTACVTRSAPTATDRHGDGAGLPGKVWLVGAGPGAADLLTLRAARLLGRADVVVHDALIDPEVLALAAPGALLVPVGKRCGKLSAAQRFINKRLVDLARQHRCVVRLKGGDPMMFGRAQEEIDALVTAGICCEVVPGISSAFAASAAVMRSLTRRGASRNVTFLTPRFGDGESAHDWARPAAAADTVVLYMASRQPQQIADGLIAAGVSPDRPAVIVESASLPGQRLLPTRVADLAATAAQLGDGPALLLVGDVFAALAQCADGRDITDAMSQPTAKAVAEPQILGVAA